MPKAVSGTQAAQTQLKTKLQTIIELLQRPDGALKKKLKPQISSTRIDGSGQAYLDRRSNFTHSPGVNKMSEALAQEASR